MKRFLLFVGANYYPSGGFDDLKGSFDEAKDAIAHARALLAAGARGTDWYQIIDTETWTRYDGAGDWEPV